jgi:lysophospholipase L1-like esterase
MKSLLLAFAVASQILAQDQAPITLPPTDEGLPGVGVIRRHQWFQDLWKSRRSAWAKPEVMARASGSVVFLGDSITQGWKDDGMAKAFDGLKSANRGISGDTTRGILARLSDDVLALNPKAVVILAGTNDLEEQMEPEAIAANMAEIIAALKAHRADMPVILCKVFPSTEAKKRPAGKIAAVNAKYQELAKANPQVTLVETHKLFANAAGDAKPEEFPDLLHPNDTGYAKWASALRPVLATRELIETKADEFTLEPGFESLFNGKDLTGWHFENGPAFDGQTVSSDGRYRAVNGRLVVQTPPTGSALAQLWTTREFGGDFTLRLQFRATPDADSGVFIRKPQLQCRDYVLAGPWKDLPHYRPQEWNDLEVVVQGTEATATCNGDALKDGFKGALPPTGPIGLEGDRGQMEYRRIRVALR